MTNESIPTKLIKLARDDYYFPALDCMTTDDAIDSTIAEMLDDSTELAFMLEIDDDKMRAMIRSNEFARALTA